MKNYAEALKKVLDLTRNTDLQVFQSVYYAEFGKTPDLYTDVLNWRQHGVVPIYMQQYLDRVSA